MSLLLSAQRKAEVPSKEEATAKPARTLESCLERGRQHKPREFMFSLTQGAQEGGSRRWAGPSEMNGVTQADKECQMAVVGLGKCY